MSDTAHVLEASRLTEGKGFFERLMDFSFQYFITQKYAKLLYGIHLLLGLIVGTWFVFNGFQASTSQGLLSLLLAVVAYFLWILYVRVALEFLVSVFRTADNIARASGARRDSYPPTVCIATAISRPGPLFAQCWWYPFAPPGNPSYTIGA